MIAEMNGIEHLEDNIAEEVGFEVEYHIKKIIESARSMVSVQWT